MSVTSINVQTLFAAHCVLGESPLWHPGRKCCYWVDIERGVLYEFHWHTKSIRTWEFQGRLSLVRAGCGDELVLALDAAVVQFDPQTGKTTLLAQVEPTGSQIRCNDGACDALGRLWIGTMHLGQTKGAGSVFLIDGSLAVHRKIPGTSISNGIAWSLDGRRMYFIDSPTQVVQSFFFDLESGTLCFERNVVTIPSEKGSPDGMAIDREGMLWIAHWGGYAVHRWDPQSGLLLDTIRLPVPNVTSCAFAGDALDHMIITTAGGDLNGDELKKHPESGNVFVVKTPVCGVPAHECLLAKSG